MTEKEKKKNIKNYQIRLSEAGASKKKPVDSKAKNPFIEKSEKKEEE